MSQEETNKIHSSDLTFTKSSISGSLQGLRSRRLAILPSLASQPPADQCCGSSQASRWSRYEWLFWTTEHSCFAGQWPLAHEDASNSRPATSLSCPVTFLFLPSSQRSAPEARARCVAWPATAEFPQKPPECVTQQCRLSGRRTPGSSLVSTQARCCLDSLKCWEPTKNVLIFSYCDSMSERVSITGSKLEASYTSLAGDGFYITSLLGGWGEGSFLWSTYIYIYILAEYPGLAVYQVGWRGCLSWQIWGSIKPWSLTQCIILLVILGVPFGISQPTVDTITIL